MQPAFQNDDDDHDIDDNGGNRRISLSIPSAFQTQELVELWLATLYPQRSCSQHQGYPRLALHPLVVTVHRGTILPGPLDGSRCHWDQLTGVSSDLGHLAHGHSTHSAFWKIIYE